MMYANHEDAIELQGLKDHLFISKYGGHGWWVRLCYHRYEDFKLIIVFKKKCSQKEKVLTKKQFDRFAKKHEFSVVKID